MRLTIELSMLVYSVALLVIVIAIQAIAGIMAQGLIAMVGPRDNLGEPSQFQARSKRVAENHKEGLLIFAPLVLVAAAADISTGMTVLGAQLFFYSRVAHAIVYLAGWPWIRPVVWAIGMAGCLLILFALF
jgi:uncharacterized MAPEG superfamily protein